MIMLGYGMAVSSVRISASVKFKGGLMIRARLRARTRGVELRLVLK